MKIDTYIKSIVDVQICELREVLLTQLQLIDSSQHAHTHTHIHNLSLSSTHTHARAHTNSHTHYKYIYMHNFLYIQYIPDNTEASLKLWAAAGGGGDGWYNFSKVSSTVT